MVATVMHLSKFNFCICSDSTCLELKFGNAIPLVTKIWHKMYFDKNHALHIYCTILHDL